MFLGYQYDPTLPFFNTNTLASLVSDGFTGNTWINAPNPGGCVYLKAGIQTNAFVAGSSGIGGYTNTGAGVTPCGWINFTNQPGGELLKIMVYK